MSHQWGNWVAFEIAFGITSVFMIVFAIACVKLWKSNTVLVRSNAVLKAEANTHNATLPVEFENLTNRALEKQTESFKNMATEPMEQIMNTLTKKIDEMNNQNATNSGTFVTSMDDMKQVNEALLQKTTNLSDVLRNSQKRGRYAEIGLERVFEMSKLEKGIHYTTQVRGDGAQPDFIVTLSEDRNIVVDSKAPLDALWEAYDTDDEAAKATAMDKHAKSVREHVRLLAKKDYPEKTKATLDYVVMVVPEYALLPALERDEKLVEFALEKKVILVTHSTLMVLLSTVNLMWKQNEMTDTVREIGKLSETLLQRLNTFAQHHRQVGNGLNNAISDYNKSVGSWDNRIRPAAEKLANAGTTMQDVPEINSIDTIARSLSVDTDEEGGTNVQ